MHELPSPHLYSGVQDREPSAPDEQMVCWHTSAAGHAPASEYVQAPVEGLHVSVVQPSPSSHAFNE